MRDSRISGCKVSQHPICSAATPVIGLIGKDAVSLCGTHPDAVAEGACISGERRYVLRKGAGAVAHQITKQLGNGSAEPFHRSPLQ